MKRCCEPRRLCDGNYRREVVVQDWIKGTTGERVERRTVTLVGCDECADGREYHESRRQPVEGKGKLQPTRIGTLSEFCGSLERAYRGGAELWWKVDPDAEDRETAEMTARWRQVGTAQRHPAPPRG